MLDRDMMLHLIAWQWEDDGRMSQRQKKKEEETEKEGKVLSRMALSPWQMWDWEDAV